MKLMQHVNDISVKMDIDRLQRSNLSLDDKHIDIDYPYKDGVWRLDRILWY
jgi:hypothetical protein